ncbi:MAG: 2-oxoacid:acceptor oxidoreductase subunit alpha [Alphaproteobacteria bacterium]|tara:strand:+ start:642 stop:2474 length:1833 start_codon:yes stop_codon:yes gene_type:complete
MTKVNDFVVKFANVNGSGSASANLMFAKSIFRMGIPVTPKNIFPSNIQGLPTWFEVRISKDGYAARREGIDCFITLNPQTYQTDMKEILPGGYLIYDNTMPRNFSRKDISYIGIPMASICADHYEDPRQRQLFKNIVCLGALAVLLKIDLKIIENLIKEDFEKKPKLIPPNIKALQLGRDYALENLDRNLKISLKKIRTTKKKILIQGNEAAGLGCVYGGATVAGWYPITPSTSLVEAFQKYVNIFRVNDSGEVNAGIVQAEDEMASVGMAIGANWNGARAFTATSGPGISLMSEFLGLAYFAEIPLVLFNIQRGGPSTGMPTRTQQSDILACAYASHGDTKHVLLFPSDPKECFEMAAQSFDLAEILQTPIIVMSDLDIGMNDWVTDPLQWDDNTKFQRGKVLKKKDLDDLVNWGRYLDVDGDGIPYRTLPGTHETKGSYFTRGTSHDAFAGYTEDGRINADNMMRITKKFKKSLKFLPKSIRKKAKKDTNIGLIYFGSTSVAVDEANDILEDQGYAVDLLRIRSFPFGRGISTFIDDHDHVIVMEQNRDAQMRSLLINELDKNGSKIHSILNFDGSPVTADFIVKSFLSLLKKNQFNIKSLKKKKSAA